MADSNEVGESSGHLSGACPGCVALGFLLSCCAFLLGLPALLLKVCDDIGDGLLLRLLGGGELALVTSVLDVFLLLDGLRSFDGLLERSGLRFEVLPHGLLAVGIHDGLALLCREGGDAFSLLALRPDLLLHGGFRCGRSRSLDGRLFDYRLGLFLLHRVDGISRSAVCVHSGVLQVLCYLLGNIEEFLLCHG